MNARSTARGPPVSCQLQLSSTELEATAAPVVAKVEGHPVELYPRVGFIVTNLSRPAERVVGFYSLIPAAFLPEWPNRHSNTRGPIPPVCITCTNK